MNSLDPAPIGILDLQGGVAEHLYHLSRVGIPARLVKEPAHLVGLPGLIIPGGESTCLGRLLKMFSLADAIRERYKAGMKVWGTCAGAILLAKEIVGEEPLLALVDIEIERNSFGSQLDSFSDWALIPEVAKEMIPLTYIRAPKIRRVGPGVKILWAKDDYIAAAESPEVLVTVFHPELTPSLAFHRYFAGKCGLITGTSAEGPALDPQWEMTSWTSCRRGG